MLFFFLKRSLQAFLQFIKYYLELNIPIPLAGIQFVNQGQLARAPASSLPKQKVTTILYNAITIAGNIIILQMKFHGKVKKLKCP